MSLKPNEILGVTTGQRQAVIQQKTSWVITTRDTRTLPLTRTQVSGYSNICRLLNEGKTKYSKWKHNSKCFESCTDKTDMSVVCRELYYYSTWSCAQVWIKLVADSWIMHHGCRVVGISPAVPRRAMSWVLPNIHIPTLISNQPQFKNPRFISNITRLFYKKCLKIS